MAYGSHGGPAFADIFMGVTLGHSFAEHNPIGDHGVAGMGHISFSDAMTEALFISAALDYGGSTGFGGFASGHLGDVPAFHGLQGTAPGPEWGVPVTLPGIARGPILPYGGAAPAINDPLKPVCAAIFPYTVQLIVFVPSAIRFPI